MIIHTGLRTDIPAFYSRWFCNRLKEGDVLVRNPYNPSLVTRYSLNPDVVDLIAFCTKNPGPMLPHMDLLKPYGQYWFVTITPYGRDIEPHVPPKELVMEDFRRLSGQIGADCMGWRYDPILIHDKYSLERHIADFEQMAAGLAGYTKTCVISFIDLYKKVQRNFPEAREVSGEERKVIGKEFVRIGEKYGMTIKACAEGRELEPFGVDCNGCMTVEIFETALHSTLQVPQKKSSRDQCACYLSCDIGAYDTCGHLCRYCYANTNAEQVKQNMRLHDPDSPLLTGKLGPDDKIHDARQESFIDLQMRMEF